MKENSLSELSPQLRNLALKTQGSAYLLELQGFAEGPPENQDKVLPTKKDAPKGWGIEM